MSGGACVGTGMEASDGPGRNGGLREGKFPDLPFLPRKGAEIIPVYAGFFRKPGLCVAMFFQFRFPQFLSFSPVCLRHGEFAPD